jgi:hypothetical protein
MVIYLMFTPVIRFVQGQSVSEAPTVTEGADALDSPFQTISLLTEQLTLARSPDLKYSSHARQTFPLE